MNYRHFVYLLLALVLVGCKKEPVASFTASSTSVEVGEDVIFTNTSTEATSFQWEFGDGTSSTEDSPTHVYTTDGVFNVELTATGEGGSSSATTTISVDYPPATAGFTVDKSAPEVDELITFTNTSENASDYYWSFGDGETSTLENPTHTYTTDGDFTVQLTATGPDGEPNADTESKTITVTMPVPVASFDMSKSKAEPGEVITFTNTSLYATTYTWDFGDGSTSTVTDPTHSFAAEGIYNVQLTATGVGGTHAVTEVVSVGAKPVAAFSMDNANPDIGETVTFTNESVDATSYLWDFGDGTSSTNIHPTHSFSAEGVYSVQLTATGLGGIDSVSHDVAILEVNIFPGTGVRDIELEETWGEIEPKVGDWSYLGNFTQAASGGGYYVIHVTKSNTYGLWIYMVSVTASTDLEDEDICFQVNCLDTFEGRTAEGIMIGSTKTEVQAAYGTAEYVDSDNDIWWYDSVGINLSFDNSETDMIGIFPAGKKKHTGFIQDLLDDLHQIQPATRF